MTSAPNRQVDEVSHAWPTRTGQCFPFAHYDVIRSKGLQDCAKIFMNGPDWEDGISGEKEFAAGQRPAFQEALRFGCKLGWIRLGRRDGVLAGTLFVLPSLFVLFALSAIYFQIRNLPWIAEMFNPSTA